MVRIIDQLPTTGGLPAVSSWGWAIRLYGIKIEQDGKVELIHGDTR